jgi:dTDP-4-amino-4,6-dideoxygalactose transaminase
MNSKNIPALSGGKPVRKHFLHYSRQQIKICDIKAVKRALKSDFLTTGPRPDDFAKSVAIRTGFSCALAVSSGSAALSALFQAAQIGPGHEVITTSMTFAASVSSIIAVGAVPVLADIDPLTANLKPECIKKCLSPKTRAILAVDYAGLPCFWDEISSLCRQKGILFFIDSAHSLGAKVKGMGQGAFCDAAVFSFHPVKAVTTGEGGVIASNDHALIQRASLISNHHIQRDESIEPWFYDITGQGYNYRMSDISAALGLSQIKRLNKNITQRNILAQWYIDNLDFPDHLTLPDPVEYPENKTGLTHSWHLFNVRVKGSVNRNLFVRAMRAENIMAHVLYIPIHFHTWFKDKIKYTCLDNCETFYKQVMALPIYPGMNETDLKSVKKAIHKITSCLL